MQSVQILTLLQEPATIIVTGSDSEEKSKPKRNFPVAKDIGPWGSSQWPANSMGITPLIARGNISNL